MASKLGRWLGTLTQDQLAEILTRRPDTLAPPVPRTLSELADRLQSRPSVSAAFHALPLPAVQLIEVIQAFGGPSVGREQIASAVGRTVDDPDLDATLRVLAQRALVWPGADGDLHMAGPLWSAFAYPLHLGPPAERLLSARNATELRKMSLTLGAPGGRTKQQIVHDLVAALRQGDIVRAAVADAPEEVRETLESVAWRGPVVRHPEIVFGYGRSANPTLDWALGRGLLVADGWQAAVMPGEVGMALRGSDWRAPFAPEPPVPGMVGVDQTGVAREAAAAAGAAVAGVTALLEVCATAPPALLKAGGVGARELRRLGRAIGTEDQTTRMWLELAHAAGLLGVAEGAVLPTAEYDKWRELEPAARLAPLLTAWRRLPAAPLLVRAGGESTAALVRSPYGELVLDLRRELLRAAAELPEGRGFAAESDLTALMTWRLPLLVGELDEDDELPTALWAEARLLGVVAHGALSPLGTALDRADLEDVARELLPESVGTALFQADLTAVVPGTPTAALAALLDSAADRESSGGAATWRFSPASVRRALDAGVSAPRLLAELSAAAAGGTLPQPLEYLVGDVARRHGQVRIRPVACVLRADDPALLTEIAATRSLGPLGLTVLAPTVLGSTKPVAETLASLRAAGYAPTGEHPDGEPLVERAEQRRAGTRPRPVPTARRPRTAEPPAPSPLDLAAKLLAGPPVLELVRDEAPVDAIPSAAAIGTVEERRPVSGRAAGADGTAAVIEFYASRLSSGERNLLGHAVEHGGLVKIHYTNADGNPSARVIEPLALHGKVIEAWCHLREEERMFSLERIEAVAPA